MSRRARIREWIAEAEAAGATPTEAVIRAALLDAADLADPQPPPTTEPSHTSGARRNDEKGRQP